MKKIVACLLLMIALSGCYHAPENDITVYVTETGHKYHQEHCRYLNYSCMEIPLSKALYKKYGRCKICRPSVQEDLDKLNN